MKKFPLAPRVAFSALLLSLAAFEGRTGQAIAQEVELSADCSTDSMRNGQGKNTNAPWHIVTACVDQVPATPPDQEALEALVTRLGAEKFPDREAATKEFAKIGVAARAALEKHADDPEPEIAFRSRALLRDLQKSQKSSQSSPEELLPAINTLIDQKDPRILHALATLLSHPSDLVRHYAEYALRRLTGDDLGFKATASEEKRAVAVVKWRKWLEDHKDTVPMPPHELQLLIVADPDRNKVVLLPLPMFVKTGKEGPDAHPDDLDIAAEAHKEIVLKAKVFSACTLPTGNLLVGLAGSPGHAAEITLKGKEVWSSAKASVGKGDVSDVKRLDNGNTLISYPASGEVFEIDPDGKVAWKATGLGAPTCAIRLANGNTLVTECSANRIAEIAPDGTVAWKRELKEPAEVVKLPNGNILASSMGDKKIYEFDENGVVVWSAEGSGASLCMLRDGTVALVGGNKPPRLIGRSGTQLASAENRASAAHFGSVADAPPEWIRKLPHPGANQPTDQQEAAQ